jgi:hypothetical protein
LEDTNVKGQTIQLGGWDPTKCEECIISGTPKPGQLAMLKPNTPAQGGRFTYQIRNLAAGTFGPICLFVEGFPMWDWNHTYANNDRGFIRWLTPGEFANVFVTIPGTGTGTLYTIGQSFQPDTTGQLVATAGGQQIFQALENVVDATGPTGALTFVQRNW